MRTIALFHLPRESDPDSSLVLPSADTVQIVGDDVDGEVLGTIHKSVSIAMIHPTNKFIGNGYNGDRIIYLVTDDDDGRQRRELPQRRIRRSMGKAI